MQLHFSHNFQACTDNTYNEERATLDMSSDGSIRTRWGPKEGLLAAMQHKTNLVILKSRLSREELGSQLASAAIFYSFSVGR